MRARILENMEEIFIEVPVSFSYENGDWHVSLFSGEFQSDASVYKLRVPVPRELVNGEIIGEVE